MQKKLEPSKKSNNKKKIIFIVGAVLLLGIIIVLLILLLRSCNSGPKPTNDDNTVSEVETYNKLLKIANDKVDELPDDEHKDEKYNVNKLLSFSYKGKDISYATYNDNYLVNVSFKISNENDISNDILNDRFSNTSIQVMDRYDYSLEGNEYYSSTYVSNSICYIGRVTPTVNHLSGTYIGNDEKIYSFTNIEFDNGDPCPYKEESNELSIYEKDMGNILYKLVYSIVKYFP